MRYSHLTDDELWGQTAPLGQKSGASLDALAIGLRASPVSRMLAPVWGLQATQANPRTPLRQWRGV